MIELLGLNMKSLGLVHKNRHNTLIRKICIMEFCHAQNEKCTAEPHNFQVPTI